MELDLRITRRARIYRATMFIQCMISAVFVLLIDVVIKMNSHDCSQHGRMSEERGRHGWQHSRCLLSQMSTVQRVGRTIFLDVKRKTKELQTKPLHSS